MDVQILERLLWLVSVLAIFLLLSTRPSLTPILMSIVSFLAQGIFLLYKALSVAILIFLVVGPVYYYFTVDFESGFNDLIIVMGLFAVNFFVVTLLFRDNVHRKYSLAVNKVVDQFIAWIGTVKYFKEPVSLVSDPGSYALQGFEIRQLIDPESNFHLKPGDILLRGYKGYLDGEMIKMTGGDDTLGKYFSHAALYVGELNDNDKEIAARRLRTKNAEQEWDDASEEEKLAIRENTDYFQTGSQMVIHSMTRGVFVEDILTFTRCDYLAVLRLTDDVSLGTKDISVLQNDPTFTSIENDYSDKGFMVNSDAIHIEKRLKNGEKVPLSVIIQSVKNTALGKIGSCYDFQFTHIKHAHQFSCSEFVYYCFKSLRYYFGMVPVKHAMMKYFFPRTTITPSDIYNSTIRRNNLKIIWLSSSLEKKGDKINQDYKHWKESLEEQR